jgi:hypothetical protein
MNVLELVTERREGIRPPIFRESLSESPKEVARPC